MKVTFLQAPQHVAKTYTARAGKVIQTPYPNVYEVSSQTRNISTLQLFHREIVKRAMNGEVLLKGEIQKQLQQESRAGSTDSATPTSWICLDIDGFVLSDHVVPSITHVEYILGSIGCDKVDYILQWSNSMGIMNTNIKDIRCHVFMLLDTPTDPRMLKAWLVSLNLTVPELAEQLTLTRTMRSLRYRLDITTCQNDKLLYIAPPILHGRLTDPYPQPKDRFVLVKHRKRKLSLAGQLPHMDSLRPLIDKRVNELRVAGGFAKIPKTRYKHTGTVDYVVNPEACVPTEIKHERNFVYFNLNGGDSWGYYHPEDNPEFIYNFKGEPTYRTQDLLPEYWSSLQKKERNDYFEGVVTDPVQRYVFMDEADSKLYAIKVERDTKVVLSETPLDNSAKGIAFLKQGNKPIPETFPFWTREWNPLEPPGCDPENAFLNLYNPSQFMLTKPKRLALNKYKFPTVEKIISHVFNYETPTIRAFTNWLAVIIQKPCNTGTAWIMQGVSGTGKGLLYNHILRPLFGAENTHTVNANELNEIYTPYFEKRLILFIDEVELNVVKDSAIARLKQAITEPVLNVRKMYKAATPMDSFLNIIMASNKRAPIRVTPDDRRYSVGPYQDTPIVITDQELDEFLPEELEQFYAYLYYFKASRDQARRAHRNLAKQQLIQMNTSSIDEVSNALIQGNMEFFWDNLPSGTPNPAQILTQAAYVGLVKDMVLNGRTKFPRDDLRVLFEWCVGGMPVSSNKFSARIKHHNIHLIQIWHSGRNVRGYEVTAWLTDPNWLKQVKKEAKKL